MMYVSFIIQFFSVDMYGADGRPLNEKQIHKLLSKIVRKSQDEGPALGILTSGHRNNWYQTHKQLVKCECVEHILSTQF